MPYLAWSYLVSTCMTRQSSKSSTNTCGWWIIFYSTTLFPQTQRRKPVARCFRVLMVYIPWFLESSNVFIARAHHDRYPGSNCPNFLLIPSVEKETFFRNATVCRTDSQEDASPTTILISSSKDFTGIDLYTILMFIYKTLFSEALFSGAAVGQYLGWATSCKSPGLSLASLSRWRGK